MIFTGGAINEPPGSEVIKLFLCSIHLSLKFKLIHKEIVIINGILRVKLLKKVICPAHNC